MQKEGSKLLWFYSSSDGVGRSGTFLCIHSQLERLKTEGEVDIFKYLKSARTRRIGLLSDPVSSPIMQLHVLKNFLIYSTFLGTVLFCS